MDAEENGKNHTNESRRGLPAETPLGPGIGRRHWIQRAMALLALVTGRALARQAHPDRSAPKVAVLSPAAGSTVSGIVPVAVKASDNVGVTRVELRANSVLVGTSILSPYQFAWNSATVSDGSATLTASAFDAAGNTASSSIAVTVANGDQAAPEVAIAAPSAGSTVSGTVTVAVTASDNVGVTRVELRANSVLVGTDTSAPYEFNWNTAAFADGSTTLMASAFDAANNTASASINVTIANADAIPPTVSITAPSPDSTVSGTVTVAVNASDNIGVVRVEVQANGNAIGMRTAAPYEFAWDTTTAPNGSVSLTAFAYDAAGNQASATESVTVANDTSAPAWYAALPVNAWSHLPVTTVSQEVCSDANPKGIVWPSTSVAENYDPTKPLVAGKHPIPGVSVTTYMAFSGGRMIENLTFARNGVLHTGNYWVRFGGGHEGSPDNSLHAIGPFDGVPKRINITDPSIPPAIDLVSDGIPQATWAPDGRPGAAEAYNSFAYIRSTNTLVIGQGAGYKESAIALYAYRFDEDGGTDYPSDADGIYATPATGWVRNTNYWPTVTFPGQTPRTVTSAGINLTQECAWMTDNVRGEVWVIPTVTSTPYAYRALVALGSTFSAIQITDLEYAASGSFFKKGWAIEGESWLVFMLEHLPHRWWVIDRDARNAYGRLQVYQVTFTGDALPLSTIANSSNQPTGGAAFDYEERCFYVWFAGNDTSVVLRDVYKIVPPETALHTTPWAVTKITPSEGITPEAPWGGIHYRVQTGKTNVGGWAPYGNFEFVPSPTRGLFYQHRLEIPPLFWRLP